MRARFCFRTCANFVFANKSSWCQIFGQCRARFWHGLAPDLGLTLDLVRVSGLRPHISIAGRQPAGDDTGASLYSRSSPLWLQSPQPRGLWTANWAMLGHLPYHKMATAWPRDKQMWKCIGVSLAVAEQPGGRLYVTRLLPEKMPRVAGLFWARWPQGSNISVLLM